MTLPRRLFLSLPACLVALAAAAAGDKPAGGTKRVLLVTHSGGFIHPSVTTAEEVLTKIGPDHGMQVTCYRLTNPADPAVAGKGKLTPDQALEKYSADFRAKTGKTVDGEKNTGTINKETLKNFDCVLFFTTGNPLTTEQTKDLVDWVKAGGAFCGTHCATDTLYGDAAYGHLIGGYFRGHPANLQKIKVRVEDPKHPAAAGFEDGQPYEDEMYVFRDAPYSRDRLHVILSIDPAPFEPLLKDKKGKNDLTRKDHDYAISWCREEGKGKVFYTSFGHDKKVWNDPKFQAHLVGGMKWAMGERPGDASPSKK